MNTQPLAWSRNTLAATISTILGAGLGTAYGQAQEPESRSVVEEVTVTGSRIRRDDFSAVNATVVVTAEDTTNLGLTSAAEMIAQPPSNVATNTAETNTDSNYFLGANIANLRGLNTFFGTRTLTLFNSRRFPATNNASGVDRFNGLQAFLNITNVGDRIPDFFSGTGPGGINTTFFSVLGRQYELGVEMRF